MAMFKLRRVAEDGVDIDHDIYVLIADMDLLGVSRNSLAGLGGL